MNSAFNEHISVDCVIFGYDLKSLKVLLLERHLHKPDGKTLIFKDLTLPGNHIRNNEDLETAAQRILFELTGLNDIYLEQFAVFSDPVRLDNPKDQKWLSAIGKDPSNRVITAGFFSLIPLERYYLKQNGNELLPDWYGKNPCWHTLDHIGDMAFDHARILATALDFLREKIMSKPVIFELLPEKFTASQFQNLYEVILGKMLDKRNFRKKLANLEFVVSLNEKQVGVAHKPARYYMFSRDVYERKRKEKFTLIT
ncbi:MAG: NUDIX hydrolase [Bacteroidetes bacterium GWF2_49_14]|nr:MAG: NUDIX hydrolase [Bacteroidetes bacterium GWF2_49_14]HBB92852.1 NUDIX hydrolase [Bacteroidales bacterium]